MFSDVWSQRYKKAPELNAFAYFYIIDLTVGKTQI